MEAPHSSHPVTHKTCTRSTGDRGSNGTRPVMLAFSPLISAVLKSASSAPRSRVLIQLQALLASELLTRCWSGSPHYLSVCLDHGGYLGEPCISGLLRRVRGDSEAFLTRNRPPATPGSKSGPEKCVGIFPERGQCVFISAIFHRSYASDIEHQSHPKN